ncbi:MAG: hypothetical protein ABI231_06435, partial [Candidatus Tumulicola sp.]
VVARESRMLLAASRIAAGALLVSLTLASCSGSGRATPALAPPPGPTAQQPQDAGRGSPPGGSSTFLLREDGYRGELTTSRVSDRDDQLRVAFAEGNETSPCPTVPRVQLTNLTASSITLSIRELEIDLPCGVGGQQFGASFFQLTPQPAIVSSNKLADAIARSEGPDAQPRGGDHSLSSGLTFKPTQQITLAPHSTSALTVLPDPSGSEVALPVAAGSTSVLTSGSQNIPTDLSFFYTSGTGGSFYTTSCFDASLLPANVPRVGRPSFFCHINPGTSSITFGTQVKFIIGAPKFDRSVLGLDGPTTTFICGTASTSTECDTPSFTVSNTSAGAFQNVIVGNVDDLRACVPVTENTDCNKLVSPAPSTPTVSSRHDFQLLAADDATYRPGAGPWDGVFHVASTVGNCHFSTAPDNGNEDVPPSPTPGSPGYTDSNQAGIGPYAEFDVTPTGTGICSITLTEDPIHIFVVSDPVTLTPRSVQLNITMH